MRIRKRSQIMAEVDEMAAEVAETYGLTHEVARSFVWEWNPELVDELRASTPEPAPAPEPAMVAESGPLA